MNMEILETNYATKYWRDISHDCTRCTSFRNFWAGDSVVKGRHSNQDSESGRVIRMQIGSRVTTRTWYFLVRRAKLTIDLANYAT